MSILSKWGFRAGNCGGSVQCMHLTIDYRYLSRSSGYAPEAVAIPRTPNIDSTFLDTLREGWQAVKTLSRWGVVEERMALES